MTALTVVFWEDEPQFGVRNPAGSTKKAALKLETRLHKILDQVKANPDWDCSDFQKAVRKDGLRTTSRIPIWDHLYWRYDARG